MYIVPKIEVREAEDIADFATTMDSDIFYLMKRYMTMTQFCQISLKKCVIAFRLILIH